MWRLLPLLLLPAAGIAVALFGLQDSLGWGQLGTRMHALHGLAEHDAGLAALLFVVAYSGFAALCLPVGPAMGVLAGALFGPWPGTGLALLGATTGALPLFLWARATVSRTDLGRYAASVAQVQRRLQRDGFLALLALRLAPVMPSWALNLGAALAGMRVRPFAAATALGLFPATSVFAHIGSGLDGALAENAPPGLDIMTRPAVLLPLLALSALALLPIAWRGLRARKPLPGVQNGADPGLGRDVHRR